MNHPDHGGTGGQQHAAAFHPSPPPVDQLVTDPGELAERLTVGVEEEFLLVDADTRRVAPAATAVLAAGAGISPVLQKEITLYQVETTSPVCLSAVELRDHLQRLRVSLARTAEAQGLRLVATGTAVLGEAVPPPLTAVDRYQRMASEFGGLIDTHSICGCHVHVGMPDPETAVQVSNHLRPWLPILLALSTNSPFWHERDTRHASWRAMIWARWPSAGPPPHFTSIDEYESAVRALLETGAAMDRGMVYWDIRLSDHQPTIEIRVCDVSPTADEAALLAALIRGLVATAVVDIRAGRPAPAPRGSDLRAALWRAAHDGLEGACLDPLTGQVTPVPVLADRLLERLRPALLAGGDLPLVTEVLRSLRASGSGAERQRRALARRGRLSDVVDLLADQTAGSLLIPAQPKPA
ncbi:carboxylate-amine ligase [Streptoalloteichus tenebrarius]|uniref:Putative glutamate--cysteine ligase 2 n=1 Tax=Streptoalloteichus tenebrarius (strain ATCC 17920 / DSM 40477 / JCM 4838 / CBS 697.72 / NBRC 16177 / NCIMB 11028 / NRRL B-12390 / A12253. 1 / ISP 5477) TaxID=1933 RepID=A0ABT1I102_STRSD|nr:glutamate--cysteine ligase [Streptoalloteichus tenebrarius]MCP2261463.1 carboxylate-amine ligase [Streptoalloteichus tenebrarius]BFE99699.1 glutamate--cysteine ligase [Streptoalloteichus tenebrarius]